MDKLIADLPELDNYVKLSDSDITEFSRNGHVLLKQVLSPDEIAAYRPVIVNAADRYNTEKRAIKDRDTYGKAFLQIMNLWNKNIDN